MKIRKIKWNNHPVLGNLELDFCNPTSGEPYSNVIFAGENGTGKTTILESISNFLNLGPFAEIEFIEYQNQSIIYRAIEASNNKHINGAYDVIDSDNNATNIPQGTNARNNERDNPINIRSEGCVFSKARADFKTTKIKASSTTELDTGKHDNDSNDDFTSLKQLLVDINSADYADYAETNQSTDATPVSWTEYFPTSKMYRFSNAFSDFFEDLSYSKIENNGGEKEILFEKNGAKISIDDLSTGEKQIVFRGCYLLKNISNISKALIFIDEPELSMHPKWERRILSYYKSLFTTAGTQTAQIFYASHSEHVLADALSKRESDLTIALTNEAGQLTASPVLAPNVLPTITSAETNYLAFDLVSNDYHIQLYGQLQINENLASVKACDDFILAHSLYDTTLHEKPSAGQGTTTYTTLPTYIRNTIHHPDGVRNFSEEELRKSIEFLIAVL